MTTVYGRLKFVLVYARLIIICMTEPSLRARTRYMGDAGRFMGAGFYYMSAGVLDMGVEARYMGERQLFMGGEPRYMGERQLFMSDATGFMGGEARHMGDPPAANFQKTSQTFFDNF